MIAQALTLAQVATIAALRATAGAAGTVVAATHNGIVQLYAWDAASTAPDDGVNVVAPNPAVAGRWTLRATLDNTISPHAALVLAVPWTPPRGAVLLADGWHVVGADATNLYVACEVTP